MEIGSGEITPLPFAHKDSWSRANVPNLPWLMSVTGYQSLAEIHLS